MYRKKYKSNLLVRELKNEDAQKLSEAKVIIAGTGVLGSIVLANLISLKTGKICIVDTNEKQSKNTSKLTARKHSGKNICVCSSNIENIENLIPITDYDIIIDCLESYDSKFVLNKIAVKNKKPLIHGAVTETYGQVTSIIPYETACLGCLFQNSDTKDLKTNEKVCPAINAIAALLSQAAADIILGQDNDLRDVLLTYNAEDLQLKKIKLSRNPECDICSNIIC